MCIRDSLGVANQPLTRILKITLETGDGGTAAFSSARGLCAVSYTHLRAHETVLDLVCRLLLEKKKIKVLQHVIILTTAMKLVKRLDI